MGIKDEVVAMKKEVKDIKEQSIAMELLKDAKKTNQRQFVIILVILAMWFASIGLFIYYINTTGYEEITETADSQGEGNACVGDSCNNGEINYGESKQNYKKKSKDKLCNKM